jgi:hypothetical protein
MKTLTELIQNYQNGIPNSDSEILKRMELQIMLKRNASSATAELLFHF